MGVLRVGVLGAGIVGLTSALELQNSLPSCQMTIIADKFNQDTLSDGAAGLFIPSASFSGSTPDIAKRWLIDSYEFYSELLNIDCGVSRTSGYLFSSNNRDLAKAPLLEGVVPVYRPTTKTELEMYPGRWMYGTYLESLLIECRRFLPWAIDRAQQRGAAVSELHVDNWGELEGQYDAIINCTGFGAQRLTGDYKLVPIRGQVIKVEAPWVKQFYIADTDTYIIPNSRGLVTLGGSRHYGSYHTNPCQYDLDAIRQRCHALLPMLKGAREVRTWAGLRPQRDPVRVEPQIIGPLKVVHNYGHGAQGVTSAPGTAKDAVQLLRTMLHSKHKL